jgi:hypothetical protein
MKPVRLREKQTDEIKAGLDISVEIISNLEDIAIETTQHETVRKRKPSPNHMTICNHYVNVNFDWGNLE